MSTLTDRIAELTPEKRLLLQLLVEESKARRGPGSGEAGARAEKNAPFALVAEEDRARLPEGLEDAYPLAMMQQGMILHMELTADDPIPAYHNLNSFHIEAPIDVPAMEVAIQRALDRHPVLRTSFHLHEFSEPLQLVHEHVPVRLSFEDLSHLPQDEQQAVLDELFARENRMVFDLSRVPLLRFFVHRRTPKRFQFTLVEPHVVSEGWSTNSTLAEIMEDYLALVDGRPLPEKPPPAFSYRDFVHLERQMLRSEQARQFWSQKLGDFTPLRLPRWPRELRSRRRGSVERKRTFYLPHALVGQLRELARSTSVTLKSVVLAAHWKVLGLFTGRRVVSTGMQFNGRPEGADGDQVRGVFVNTLPVVGDLRPGTWADLVRRAFAAEIELMDFRRYPLAALQRQLGGEPLFEVALTYIHFHGVEEIARSGRFTGFRHGISDRSVSHFPLSVTFHLMGGVGPPQLLLILEFDDTEIAPRQIDEVRGCFEKVLAEMVRDPEGRHDQKSFLSDRQRQQILNEWTDSGSSSASHRHVHRWIEAQARRTPDAPAVAFEGERWTYRELNARSNQLARHLRRLGVTPDLLVGLCLERSPWMVMGILGIFKAGAAYLPLDPTYPRERLDLMLRDANVSVLVSAQRLVEPLPPQRARLVALDQEWEAIGAERTDDLSTQPAPESIAYVIYTSGSTGVPKGVMVSHANLVHTTAARCRRYPGEVDAFLLLSSFAFDSSIVGIFWTLCTGGTLVLPGPGLEVDAVELVRLLRDARITHFFSLPSFYKVLLAQLRSEGSDAWRELVLRLVTVGGEVCPPQLLEQHRRALPETELFSEYGPTEGTVWASAYPTAGHDTREPVSIGRTIAGTRLYLLSRSLQPVPIGAVGEICIGGSGVTRGYLNHPAKTGAKFVPDPFGGVPGERLYASGDMARWAPSGGLDFVGREDHQVKIRGFRIELGEIDAVLSRHPGILETAVVAREDDPGERRLVAYLVPRQEPAPGVDQMLGFLREQLPEHMVPSAFVILEAFPRLANGKIDRRALPAPTGHRPELQKKLVAPRTELEATLAELWREVLKLDEVGIDDNFFDLGGNSLLMVQIHRLHRERLGPDISITDLFQFPTIASLARHLSRHDGAPSPDSAQQHSERMEARGAAVRHQGSRRAALRQQGAPR